MENDWLNKYMSLQQAIEAMSEENEKSWDEYVDKIIHQDKILQTQLERFHIKYSNNFSEIVEKIKEKYQSDKYRSHWYNQGIEPPEPLYDFLFDYATIYGRECHEEEWKRLGGIFTTQIYFVNDYYFCLQQGQGAYISIHKKLLN